MCGIVGYVGRRRKPLSVVVEGLTRLEYRGYDSAGVCLAGGSRLRLTRAVGPVDVLRQKLLSETRFVADSAVGHTRWATHGGVTEANAHPHLDEGGTVAVVHNGIIENYRELQAELLAAGVSLRSETDTEVIPNLMAQALGGGSSVLSAFLAAVSRLVGTYGIVASFSTDPGKLYVARSGSPIALGRGSEESFIASDPIAFSPWTSDVVYLEDGDVAVVEAGDWEFPSMNGPVIRTAVKFEPCGSVTKDGYDNFMAKEIEEQPESFERCVAGRIDLENEEAHLGGVSEVLARSSEFRQVMFLGCGTSFYAGAIGAMAFERIAGMRSSVDTASEFRYRSPVIDSTDLVVGVSQSGETADTLHALRLARARGATTVGVVNVVGSSIARECGQGVYVHSGPEMAVASTKAFTSQVGAVLLLAMSFGRSRTATHHDMSTLVRAVSSTPSKIRQTLARHRHRMDLAVDMVLAASSVVFVGRGPSALVAAEGALKLKEIAYVPCVAYPAGEMKHGPIALLDDRALLVAVVPNDEWRDKSLSNVHEARARGCRTIVVHTEDDTEVSCLGDVCLPIPPCEHSLASPLLTVIPLQLLALYAALARGTNVDRPRNLAKSVTVE